MDLARFAIFAGIIIINFHYVTSVSCLIVFIDGLLQATGVVLDVLRMELSVPVQLLFLEK